MSARKRAKDEPGKKNRSERRTQLERREASQALIMASACERFGTDGYADTSIDAIAADAGMTTGPIFHYYKNKQCLFEAVVVEMENRMVALQEQINEENVSDRALALWRGFLELSLDPVYRQIVLVDCPNILGRERLIDSAIANNLLTGLEVKKHRNRRDAFRTKLQTRMFIAAFIECALMLAETSDTKMVREETDRVIGRLLQALSE